MGSGHKSDRMWKWTDRHIFAFTWIHGDTNKENIKMGQDNIELVNVNLPTYNIQWILIRAYQLQQGLNASDLQSNSF